MPGFDGKGPEGRGPTGGRRGKCSSEYRAFNSDQADSSLAKTCIWLANKALSYSANLISGRKNGLLSRRRNR